jgi:hypothetical protein
MLLSEAKALYDVLAMYEPRVTAEADELSAVPDAAARKAQQLTSLVYGPARQLLVNKCNNAAAFVPVDRLAAIPEHLSRVLSYCRNQAPLLSPTSAPPSSGASVRSASSTEIRRLTTPSRVSTARPSTSSDGGAGISFAMLPHLNISGITEVAPQIRRALANEHVALCEQVAWLRTVLTSEIDRSHVIRALRSQSQRDAEALRPPTTHELEALLVELEGLSRVPMAPAAPASLPKGRRPRPVRPLSAKLPSLHLK